MRAYCAIDRKDEDQQDGDGDEPRHHGDRQGLEQDDLAPLPVVLLEIDRFLAE